MLALGGKISPILSVFSPLIELLTGTVTYSYPPGYHLPGGHLLSVSCSSLPSSQFCSHPSAIVMSLKINL